MSASDNAKEFMIILRGGVPPSELSPERMQYLMNKFQDWMGKIARGGQLKGAGRLEDGGKCITGYETQNITDGPFAEAKEVIGGYFVVQASDLGAAVEIAKGCPILENRGSVEVRALMMTPGN
jgi:hypothetical protein